MDYFLEEDIIDAFNNDEIDDIDVINLYQYGFISEELIVAFIEEGYLRETIDELLEDYSSLEEGTFRKILHRIGQYGSLAAGAAAGLVTGGPLAAAVGGKASHDTYMGITKFLKKRREERKKKEEEAANHPKASPKPNEQHPIIAKTMHKDSEKGSKKAENPAETKDPSKAHAGNIGPEPEDAKTSGEKK